jgi:hypothetical protein
VHYFADSLTVVDECFSGFHFRGRTKVLGVLLETKAVAGIVLVVRLASTTTSSFSRGCLLPAYKVM